jgi:two-component system chemotaxis response regulator CheB
MKRIRVLIVDGVSSVRQRLRELLGRVPEFDVVGAVATGQFAIAKLSDWNPDVVVLDVATAEHESQRTLTTLHQRCPALSVVVFSALTHRGSRTALDILELGASGYVTKPIDGAEFERCVLNELVPKIKSVSPFFHRTETTIEPTPPQILRPDFQPLDDTRTSLISHQPTPSELRHSCEIVAIATSTGGPGCLADLLSSLPPFFDTPIVIVQHMASGFTAGLVDSLRRQTGRDVREVTSKQPLDAAPVWIAPGGRHVVLERQGITDYVIPNDDPPEGGCSPSANILFRSVASLFGARSLAVVLTGIGCDGLEGCRTIRRQGGTILAQDEASSVAWGMPGQVANAGLADAVVPLAEMAHEICRRTVWMRRQHGHGASS